MKRNFLLFSIIILLGFAESLYAVEPSSDAPAYSRDTTKKFKSMNKSCKSGKPRKTSMNGLLPISLTIGPGRYNSLKPKEDGIRSCRYTHLQIFLLIRPVSASTYPALPLRL